MSFENFDNEDLTLEQAKRRVASQEEQLEQIRQTRLHLRRKIRDFMEEETGVAYKIEDDLSEIMKKFTQEQQQNVYGKIMLFQKFPS